MMQLVGTLTPVGSLKGSLSGVGGLSATLTGGIVRPFEYYEGTYEITPSRETQVMETASKSMAQNVIIHPIPQNYGLIGWNGAVLTVQ